MDISTRDEGLFGEQAMGSDTATRNVKGSQSVYRAISVLRGVARNNRTGITATALCEELDLTPATTHRLLQVLLSENILTIDPYSKRYHLGLGLYSLGIAAHDFAIREHVFARMTNLKKLSGETVFLFIRSGADSLCLMRIDGDAAIPDLTLSAGSRRPLGVGAGGLALLAAQPTRFVDKVLRSNTYLYADYFDAPLEEIKRWVAETRQRGFAFNDGRLRSGVRAVGVAIGPAGARPSAAVSIAASDARMSEARRAEFERLLKNEFESLDWSLLDHEDHF